MSLYDSTSCHVSLCCVRSGQVSSVQFTPPRLNSHNTTKQHNMSRNISYMCTHTYRARHNTTTCNTWPCNMNGDSSIISVIRGGILMYMGDFPKVSSQGISVGIILAGRLGVYARIARVAVRLRTASGVQSRLSVV